MKYCVGLDIGGTNTKAMIMTAAHEKLLLDTVPTVHATAEASNLPAIIQLIEALIARAGLPKEELLGIGVGVAGLMNSLKGVAVRCPVINWWGVDVATPIQEHFHRPVWCENDGNINLLGEWKFGAAQGKKNCILITLGTGVGGGVMVDGRLMRGRNGLAGELGHVIVQKDGEPCRCGAKGCIQSYCDAEWLNKRTLKLMEAVPSPFLNQHLDEKGNVPLQLLSVGYDDGDAICQTVIGETAEYLGDALLTVINLFNPELILLGGGISKLGERLFEPVRQRVRSRVMVQEQFCDILPATLGSYAGVYGSCAIVLENLAEER